MQMRYALFHIFVFFVKKAKKLQKSVDFPNEIIVY